MSYIGNIGTLRKSIYVKEALPKKKRKPKSNNKVTTDSVRQYKELIREMFTKPLPDKENLEVGTTDRLKDIRNQYDNEIKIHGEQTSIREGFVYLIVNRRYPEWIKAGMTVDYEKRLSVYNQYDPESSFEFVIVKWVNDRRLLETILLEQLSTIAETRNGEWFKIDKEKALSIFESK